MAEATAEELFIRTLAAAGVRSVHGAPGDFSKGAPDGSGADAEGRGWVVTRGAQLAAFAALVAQAVDRLAAPDAIFTVDADTLTMWAARDLTVNGARRLIGSYIHGSMAGALKQAIGAQIAAPGRQVVAFVGDAGAPSLKADLAAARAHRLPVKIILLAGGTHALTAGVVNGRGVLGLRAHKPEEVEPALDRAFRHSGPVLVAVRVNRPERSRPPPLTRFATAAASATRKNR
jgi:thiamine pyrophosphate-dependent acetolactate synthase large subunit-like protein